ncbi:MAG: hypothetical protein DSY34_00675 [Desulfurobacterium sp.]|nr:MAG: hypothetical protein DSY34_00675 [Desulfurobacterium sp.]
MFKATLANPEQCPNPAKLVEIELLPCEGGKILGNEKRPNIKEFVQWLHKAGVKKETEENLDGTVDFKFYTRTLGKGATWRLRKVYRLKP